MKSKKLEHKLGSTHYPYPCAHCGKEFKYESERKRHEQSHSPQFECKVCAKKFSFLSAVRRHEKQHERTGTFVCDQCNREFLDEHLLKRHINYAHEGSFTCKECGVTCSSEIALRAHTKTHRPASERRFRCSHRGCGKTFNFSHHLKHHVLTHTKKYQHFCNVCGKGFIQSHHLKSHKKKHDKVKKQSCEISGCQKKIFSSESDLKRHLETHKTKEKLEDIEELSASERKSSCDVSEMMEFDAANCVSSDNELLQDHNIAQAEESAVIIEYKEISLEHSKTPAQDNNIIVKIELDNDISTCESYVGGCIMGADSDDAANCVSSDNELLQDHNIDQAEESAVKIEYKEISLEQYKTPAQDNNIIVKIELENDISTCESYVGGCIMGADSDGNNCLCAQISGHSTAIEELATTTLTNNNEPNANEGVKKDDNTCKGCECSSNKNGSKTAFENSSANDVPKIEYRNDGTIRIKNTFDIDIPSCTGVRVTDQFDIPNSCKAVLGKCIVSGNGVIDEGCLCARMAMDDQQMISQEIDELTPCPK